MSNGSLIVIESNGYCSDTSELEITTTLDLKTVASNSTLVYPNPSHAKEVTITNNKGIKTVTIYNQFGQEVYVHWDSQHTQQWELRTPLTSGIYTLKLVLSDNSTETVQLMVSVE